MIQMGYCIDTYFVRILTVLELHMFEFDLVVHVELHK